ncbi:Serine/threonine-protein kinase Aurora-1 [Labeo rohita]|uniref:Serine/threonine-protein kinase Aurora-1 n=1 Tax=Labeo rohita TaxID=84645 RepID=A0ABQ8MAP3_LABRO|nr:Serine/threonine-protein kinase Aurora-1 [Labeo rohita]
MDQARNREVAERAIGRRMCGGRRVRGRSRAVVSDEIRATVIDHVINHGLSMREAGLRVQPNLQHPTVASIVGVFQQTNRTQCLPPNGGRGKMFTDVQKMAIVDMVIRTNAIKPIEIRDSIGRQHYICKYSQCKHNDYFKSPEQTSGQDEAVVHCAF